MKTNRAQFLHALEIIKPAIATKNVMEELLHIWFDGKTAMAYNDIIGISVPLRTEIAGGLRGALIIGLLDNSKSKEIEIVPGGEDELQLTAANAKAKLALLGPDRSVWQFPEVDNKLLLPITKEFLESLDRVMLSVGSDTTRPDYLGVTIIFNENVTTLFTTDSKTISMCPVKLVSKSMLGSRVCLPKDFCDQLLRLCKTGGKIHFEESHAVAVNADGVQIFTRLIEPDQPLDFEGTISDHLEEKWQSRLAAIPKGIKLPIERSLIMLADVPGVPVHVTISKGAMRLTAKVAHGELKDAIKFEGKHDDVTALLDPALIKRGLDSCSRMLLTPEVLVMEGHGEYVYLVTSYAS